MAVTYGFFNSVNGDRKYNAEQMSEYFRGIVNEGVFQHLDGGLAVTAGTGLAVSVASGRAIIQNRWVQNSDAMTLSISAASETYARKDAVVVRLNYSTRSIEIAVKAGTPAASPVAPSMTRNSTTYEMALAYVNVAANATSVTITDKRSDSTVCGWATVAQSTSGEVDAQLNAMKTGFDGVEYPSPEAAILGQFNNVLGNLSFDGIICSFKNQNINESTGAIQYVTTKLSTDKIMFPYAYNMVFNKTNASASLKIGWYSWDKTAAATQFTWSGWKTDNVVDIIIDVEKIYCIMFAKTDNSNITFSDLSGAFFTSSTPNDVIEMKSDINTYCISKNLIGNEAGVLYPCFIPAGSYITVSTSDGNNFTESGLQILFYDSNKTQLDYFTLGTTLSKRSVKYDSADTYYIALNKLDAVPLQAEYGNVKTSYSEYFGSAKALYPEVSANKSALKNIIKSTFNLNKALTFTKTRIGYPYGNQLSSDDWACTGFISVNKGDVIYYRLSGVNPNSSAVAFYTGAKTAISASSIPSVAGEQHGVCVVPDGAVFVRFCNKINTDGDVIFLDYIPDNVKTDGVPYYWLSALDTAENTIKANKADMSANLVEFCFVTDVHWKYNAKKSPYLINKLAHDLDNRMVVFGGDQITGYNDTQDGAFDELGLIYQPLDRLLDVASTVGNHDTNDGNPSSSEHLTKAQIYNVMLKRMEHFASNNIPELCSYWDNANQKVRFIQFYRPYDQPLTQNVKSWIETVIGDLPSGWSVVFFSHSFWSSANVGDPLVTSSYGKADVDYLVGLCETRSVTPIAWIVGHTHRDYSEVVENTKSLLVICTTTDSYVYGNNESGYSMTKGTATEQAFDYFQIDTDNKVIKATRIGAGNNRNWTYE